MNYRINKITLVIFFAITITISACGSSGNKKVTSEEKTISDTTEQKNTDEAELTAEQMKAVDIQIGIIEQKNLTSVVKASGQLTVPPESKAVVNALVGGVIRKINVAEGQFVKKGQVVVVIENPDFLRLQQDYLTSKDNLVYLQQEYERQSQLKSADAGIGKVYQQASANLAAERSKLITLSKQLQQIHINPARVSKGNLVTQVSVLSPLSGTIGHISLSLGTYTDASTPIMEIVDNTKIHCDLLVYEKDIAKVKAGQSVRFVLTNQDNKQVSGQVYGINKSFEGETKAVIVHTVLNNVAPLNLIPGMYVSALIETGKQMVSAVPKEAIIKANDKAYIFVLAGNKKEETKQEKDETTDKSKVNEVYTFKMVEVITGVEELDYVEIKLLQELPPDTKIVTKGAFYINSKMQTIETDDI